MYGLSDELSGAVIGSATTLVVSAVGLGLALWRLNKETKNALQLASKNEATRLKLKIYETAVLPAVSTSVDAEATFSTYLRLFVSQTKNFLAMKAQGIEIRYPNSRVPELIKIKSDYDNSVIAFITFVESWIVIDPRFEVFQVAINVAIHDLNTNYNNFLSLAMRAMPAEGPNGVVKWNVPDTQNLTNIEMKIDAVLSAIDVLGSYVADFRTEAQNILVAPLFGNTAKSRVPLDPRLIVVGLDNHLTLMTHFENDTPWGQYKQKLEQSVLEGIAKRDALKFSDKQ